MADQLGRRRASPRDVMDLHLDALWHTSTAASPARAQAYAEEGRLLVLELMGYLAAYYRKYAPAAGWPEAGDGDAQPPASAS